MKKPSDGSPDWDALRDRIIGLGDSSIRKSHFPELRRRLTELERLKGLLSDIINFMPSVIISLDGDGRINQWNRQAEDLTGVLEKEALSNKLSQVFPRLAAVLEIQDCLVEPPENRNHGHPTRLTLDADGERRHFEITCYASGRGKECGFVIRMDDVTRRLFLEEAVIQAEKMVSLGGLAAGMAHEINNPLAGILQNLQVIENRLFNTDLPANRAAARTAGVDLDDVAAYLSARGIPDLVSVVREGGLRAADIVRNMLSFSRKSTEDFRLQNLAKLLEKTVQLVATDYDQASGFDFRQIQVERRYDSDLPEVLCDPSKLQQVFYNILRNGAQAMKKAGTTSPRFILRCFVRGDRVVIEIEDNGPGMDETVRRRIFEPFFTGGNAPGNVGLGLSVSYFIICEVHGGSMQVDSEPGRSTVFRIFLPITR